MQETPNLKLKKPDLTDYVNVGDLNENADKIDAAITENKEDLATHLAEFAQHIEDESAHGIGDKSALKTVEKGTIVNAVNELFTNVSNGKLLVGRAITDVDDKVNVPTDPTFQELADAIGKIQTGIKLTVGEIIIASSPVGELRGASSLMKVGEIKILEDLTEVRVRYKILGASASGGTCKGAIYVNGIRVGLIREERVMEYAEDIYVTKNDLVQLYIGGGTSHIEQGSFSLSVGPELAETIE